MVSPTEGTESEGRAGGVIAIDPGIHHLGLAVITHTGAILEWRLVNLTSKKKPTIAELVEGAVGFVQELEHVGMEIRIEQQPVNNTKMKVLSHVLQGLFLLKGSRVKMVNPKTYKLAGGSYASRKRDAVQRVTELVRDDAQWGTVFLSSTKKDDLADALLLAMFQQSSDSKQH